MKKIVTTLFIFFFLTCFAFAQTERLSDIKEKAAAVKEKAAEVKDKAVAVQEKVTSTIDSSISGLWARLVTYLGDIVRQEKAKEPPKLETTEAIIIIVGDLLLSLFCLLLGLSLVAKASVPKKYLWFLFAFNISWFIITFIGKGVWGILDYLIIKLQPDYAPGIYNNFFIAFVIFTIFIYIWLLARTFGLNFLGAVGSFAVAHLAYFFVVMFFFAVYNPAVESKLYLIAKDSIGIRGVVSSYVADMNNISTNTSLMSLIKIKYFHI